MVVTAPVRFCRLGSKYPLRYSLVFEEKVPRTSARPGCYVCSPRVSEESAVVQYAMANPAKMAVGDDLIGRASSYSLH